MKNRFKVVMLPTQKATTLFSDNGFLRLRDEPHKNSINQHLYIVDTKNAHKIIASTDSSLGVVNIPSDIIAGVIDKGIESININNFYYSNNEIIIDWGFHNVVNNLQTSSYENNKEKEFLSTKEQALLWWDTLNYKDKGFYADKYFGFNQKNYKYLKDEEIEEIYDKFAVEQAIISLFNTVQDVRDGKLSIKKEKKQKPQVDFSLLKKIDENYFYSLDFKKNPINEIDNILLFFECMKNPSFAHKASKWFQKS